MDLITNLQTTKQVMPTVGSFHNPTPSLESRILFPLPDFFSARFNMRDIPTTLGRPTQLRIIVAFVTAKMLTRFLLGRWTPDDHRIQRRTKSLHVVPVRTREGERQRHAVSIGEQMPLGAQFAPIGGVWTGLVPPFTGAETIAPSNDWNCQSMPWRSS